jgi:acetolactate synthase-1/2/3 large subunit
MKVSDFIVEELIKRGTTHVFCLQGGFSMHLNDSIGHSALRTIYMLTEAGAAYAAAGWAQYTGKMGVCVVTAGLAQTNALSGVASAFSDYLPMMVISGDINSDLITKRDREGLRQGGQQDVSITDIAKRVTKVVYQVDRAYYLPSLFDYCWALAMAEPRGPVWLDIPLDTQQEAIPK